MLELPLRVSSPAEILSRATMGIESTNILENHHFVRGIKVNQVFSLDHLHASWALFWAAGLQRGSMNVDCPARVWWDADLYPFWILFGCWAVSKDIQTICASWLPGHLWHGTGWVSQAKWRIRRYGPFPESTNGKERIYSNKILPSFSFS